jgi:two-component system chemotaxis response regulator CheB
MTHHDVVVIGASAGGVEALRTLVAGLPPEFNAAIMVVLHIPATAPSVLDQVLSSAGPLPASVGRDGERFHSGHIYVPQADFHLMLRPHQLLRVVRGPRENRARPSVDVLFRSAARFYAGRVIGVLLSGSLYDGVAGLQVIKVRGGLTVVQSDPIFPSMPMTAASQIDIDHSVPIADMAALLQRLVALPADEKVVAAHELDVEDQISEMDPRLMESEQKYESFARPSHYTCPDCHGTLWQIDDQDVLRFRCRVGHGFTGESLMAVQNEDLEGVLWTALRALEEKASLLRQMAERQEQRQHSETALRFRQNADDIAAQAEVLRNVLLHRSLGSGGSEG